MFEIAEIKQDVAGYFSDLTFLLGMDSPPLS